MRVFDEERIFGDMDGLIGIAAGWVTNAVENDFLTERSYEQLFEMGSFKMMGTEAFFSRPSPFFVNYIPFTDDTGNLLFDITRNNTWATWAITAAGDSALAWEFMIYLLEAYYAPIGRAAVEPIWGTPVDWANESLATPIKRTHFESKTRMALEAYSNWPGTGFTYTHGSPERIREIDNAIQILAAQNEMPAAHINPFFPPLVWDIISPILENLQHGLITTEAAAQQIHNSIQLWLIE